MKCCKSKILILGYLLMSVFVSCGSESDSDKIITANSADVNIKQVVKLSELVSEFEFIALDSDCEKAYFKRNGVINLADYINENSSLERKAFILIPDKGRETALVTSIDYESPAYKCGVRQYDIIEKFNGGTFSSYNVKYAKMRQAGKGETFTFCIDRSGQKKRISFFWPITE